MGCCLTTIYGYVVFYYVEDYCSSSIKWRFDCGIPLTCNTKHE